MKAIEDVKKDAEIEISGRITVVDGKKAVLYLKNFGENVYFRHLLFLFSPFYTTNILPQTSICRQSVASLTVC